MIKARPNSNGNTPAHFLDCAMQLSESATLVQDALANCYANVFHGRNYQTVQDGAEARDSDDAQLREAYAAIAKVKDLAQAIGKASRDR